ncbi:MAG: hypothetical protein KAZ88_01435 [Acidimicrobiia bacterium]|jgi:hypothetical protein|nr:hypothetical protein [Acidimicrobiia bacterium]MBP8179637.1 hypothetical protein [Acidimicrobiia bacterium]
MGEALGGIIIALLMVLGLPIAVMLGGLLWSALIGASLDSYAVEKTAAEGGSDN